jgi:hypothetical protein
MVIRIATDQLKDTLQNSHVARGRVSVYLAAP